MGLLDDLISKHVKRRELLLVDKSMEGREKRFRRRPFITVSREAGSGGRPVAQAVAKKLGFKFYDRKIIELTAKKAKRRESSHQFHSGRIQKVGTRDHKKTWQESCRSGGNDFYRR